MAEWFLSLENFKSIHRLERLEGRPITLLLGPNNAGKTSVLQAFLLLKGSLAYPEAVLSFRNELVDLGSFRETVTQGHKEKGIAITLGETFEQFSREAMGLITLGETSRRISFRVDTEEGTLQMRRCEIERGNLSFRFHRPFPPKEPTAEYVERMREGEQGKEKHLERQEVIKGLMWRSFLPEILVTEDSYYPLGEGFRQFFESIQYIGPLRVYPERSYPLQPPPVPDVGIDGRWAPNLLRRAQPEQLQDLHHWLGPEQFGLVQDIRARDVEDLPHFVVEVNVQGQWVNLRDVGFGMSQLLPIVVESLLVSVMPQRRSPLLLLEQPEIHLHPKAQADLGTFIAEMARKGRRYLIETHSEYLLMRLATEVRRGNLSPDDIAIYFLDLDEHGHTQFRHIPLEEDGRLPPPGEWPEGFFDTDIEEAEAFLFAPPGQEGE